MITEIRMRLLSTINCLDKDIYEDKKDAQEIDEEYFVKHPEELKIIEGFNA